MQLGELGRLNVRKDHLFMEHLPQRVWKEGLAQSEALIFIFRQSPEVTHPVGEFILREPSVLRFWEKAPGTRFVLLSLLSSPATMAGTEQAGVPTCGPGTQTLRGEASSTLEIFAMPLRPAAHFWPHC